MILTDLKTRGDERFLIYLEENSIEDVMCLKILRIWGILLFANRAAVNACPRDTFAATTYIESQLRVMLSVG